MPVCIILNSRIVPFFSVQRYPTIARRQSFTHLCIKIFRKYNPDLRAVNSHGNLSNTFCRSQWCSSPVYRNTIKSWTNVTCRTIVRFRDLCKKTTRWVRWKGRKRLPVRLWWSRWALTCNSLELVRQKLIIAGSGWWLLGERHLKRNELLRLVGLWSLSRHSRFVLFPTLSHNWRITCYITETNLDNAWEHEI